MDILKRVLPFAAALFLGVFLTGLIIPASPSDCDRRCRHQHRYYSHQEFKQMNQDERESRRDRCRMKKRFSEIDRQQQ